MKRSPTVKEVMMTRSYERAARLSTMAHEVSASAALLDEQENVLFCYASWGERVTGKRILRECGISENAMHTMQRSVSLRFPYVTLIQCTKIKPCPGCGKDVNPVREYKTGTINNSIAHYSCAKRHDSNKEKPVSKVRPEHNRFSYWNDV